MLDKKGKFFVADALFTRAAQVTLDRAGDGRPGDLVLLGPGKGGKAKVLRRIGSPELTRDVLEALMLENGLWRRFAPRVIEEAQAAAELVPEFARRDLTGLPTFTMDPVTAKDYDDAISARREHDGVRVWVHIADVSAYVRPGSALDSEAFRRAFSVYVPGAVEPMLPHELSSDACSLVPFEDRNVVTAEILMRAGEPVSASFYRAVICSDARLTYGQVDEIFAGKQRAQDPWGQTLVLARKLAARLEQKRKDVGALEVYGRESAFSFDDQGRVVSMHHEEQTESHRVIEHLMVLANEQVAGYLEDRRTPTLYRIHEKPDPESIEFLVQQLESLEVPTVPIPQTISPQQAAELVGEISRSVDKHVRATGHGRAGITSLVLRALKMAVYSPNNVGHSGLRSPRYSHFTSPIRRYPDLVVHRSLLASLGLDDYAPDASSLPEIAAETSGRERDGMKIERKADDICRAFLLQQAMRDRNYDEPFEGEVFGMVGSGMFISFGDQLQYEGFLPLRRVEGHWDLNEFGTAMVEAGTGTQVRIGDAIDVCVERVDAQRGRTDLLPAA